MFEMTSINPKLHWESRQTQKLGILVSDFLWRKCIGTRY